MYRFLFVVLLVILLIMMGASSAYADGSASILDSPNLVLESEDTYSETYLDTETGMHVLVVDRLPRFDYKGDRIEVGWVDKGYYLAKQNTFVCVVQDDRISIIAENDQYTKKAGDSIHYRPHLFSGSKELLPKDSRAQLLVVDPMNAYYESNVLEWDYGVCKRYVRLIEGQVQGWWVFTDPPPTDLRFEYDNTGNAFVGLGPYAVDEDTEYVSIEDFEWEFRYHDTVYIGDQAIFNPDASPETNSVDGHAAYYNAGGVGWATIHDSAGNASGDTTAYSYCGFNRATGTNEWILFFRTVFLFYTAALPDDCTISSATFSLYTYSKQFTNPGVVSSYNVYTSDPASNTAVASGDYIYTKWGETALCDTALAEGDLAASDYNDWALNDSGIAEISKTGVTKLGLRWVNDAEDDDPSIANQGEDYFLMYMSEQGVGYKPKLVVVYSTGAAPYVPGRSNSMYCPQSGAGGAIY